LRSRKYSQLQGMSLENVRYCGFSLFTFTQHYTLQYFASCCKRSYHF